MLDISLGPNDFRVDTYEEGGTLADIKRYGDWSDRDKNGRFFVPSLLSGSDYSGTLVERSNHKVFEETYPRGEGKWWKTVHGGHGTFAIVIDLKKVPKKRQVELTDFFDALQGYPLADENLHSEMEMAAQEEAWEDWAKKDFKKALEKKFNFEFDEVDDGKIADLFQRASERAGIYWINEQGDQAWIDIPRIVERGKISANDIDDLGATFSKEEFKENGPGLYIVHGERPRRTEEEVYETFEAAEQDGYDTLSWYRQNYEGEGSAPPVQIVEARSRNEAEAGRGYVWWEDGIEHGPPVPPGQARFSFGS